MGRGTSVQVEIYYDTNHWTVWGYGIYRAVLMNGKGSIRHEVGSTPHEAVNKLLNTLKGEGYFDV